MKLNATAREEEVRKFPGRYIDSVKSPNGRMLWSDRKMRDAFRDRFARCTNVLLQEFRCYLAEFPRFGAAEAAACNGVVAECELRDELK